MRKTKRFLPTLFYNKFFWEFILAAFMIGVAIYFISHEHLEVFKIKEQLSQCVPKYVLLGLLLTVLYLLLQGEMYIHSFRALNQKISMRSGVRLYLRRNLISIFLPAGGFSSLMFFTKDVENEGASKSQIYLASTLFGFMSFMSVIVVGIPILGFAMFSHDVQQAEILAFASLLFLTIVFIFFIFSVLKKGKAYRLLSRIRPSWTLKFDEILNQGIKRKEVWLTLFCSTLIEIIGILHLYISMLALGVQPSWPAAMLGYITMVVLLMASPFLRGMGAIEVSVTYILGQFGYNVLTASAITLLFRFFEFWLPLMGGVISFITRKDNLILRVLPVFLIFVLGLVNIISSITPVIPERLLMIQDILPDEIISTSNGLVLVSGLILVMVSVFLLQGSRRAWYVGIILTVISSLAHLLRGADYEETLLAFVVMASLLYTKSYYQLKPHPQLMRISYKVLAYGVVGLLAIGVTGLYFMDKPQFVIDFEFWVSLKTILRMLFLFDSSGLDPRTAFGQDFIYFIYVCGGLVLGFIFFSILKPYFSTPKHSKEDRELAVCILKKYGGSALDYFKTGPDKLFFFSEDRDGFISFKISRNFALVLENPVCKDEKTFLELIKNFDQFCQENGFISAYYRVPGESMELYKKLGKKSLPVGDEAIIDLVNFTLGGNKMKPTIDTINRLEEEGYSVNIYISPIKDGLLQKLEHVSQNWLDELHQKEVAFTEGVFNREVLKGQTIITVEDKEDKVHAYLNLIPDYVPGEATYDMVRSSNDASEEVWDMLLIKTFQYLKEQGYKSVNLGLAPLSGVEGMNFTEKTVKYAYDNMKTLGHFKGLRKYKDKFIPRWEQKYLIYNHNYQLFQIPKALKRVSVGK